MNTDYELFGLLLEVLGSFDEARLSRDWEAQAQVVPWVQLPMDAKLSWAQMATLARVSSSFEEIQRAYALLLERRDLQ